MRMATSRIARRKKIFEEESRRALGERCRPGVMSFEDAEDNRGAGHEADGQLGGCFYTSCLGMGRSKGPTGPMRLSRHIANL